MTATLLGAFACGFLAAGLVSVFRFLVVAVSALVLLALAMMADGFQILQIVAAVLACFALSQVGFGLGLTWTARRKSNERRL